MPSILALLRRIPFFRIWYSTTYTVIFFILIIFLAVTPGDTIYQSIRTNELEKLFSVGGVYVLTFIVTILVYSTRLYTNRTVLQAIPKPYVPIEDGEIGKMVRKMIVKALKRSAIVAYDSRPRDVRAEQREEEDGGLERPTTADASRPSFVGKRRSKRLKEATVIPVNATAPPWGHISHPGWAAPDSEDMPNLQYWSVITELPNLIEAKAVSLAPPDPAIEGEEARHMQMGLPMLPDAQVVALLQRPRAMGVREYLSQLASYGLINPPNLGPRFLAQYEYARFSTHAITETEFKELMAIFAEILNGMTELDPEVIEEARMMDGDSETRSLAPSESSGSSTSTQSLLPYRTPRMMSINPYHEVQTGGMAAHREGSEDLGSPQTLRSAHSLQRQVSSDLPTIPSTSSEHSPTSRAGSVVFRSIQTSRHTNPQTPSERSVRSMRSFGSEAGSVRVRPRQNTIYKTPSERSFASRTGSVVIRPQHSSPSTILPNSSSSSIRSGGSVIRLHPSPGDGDLPYQYQYDETEVNDFAQSRPSYSIEE